MVSNRNTVIRKMLRHYDVSDYKGNNSKASRRARKATVRRFKRNERNTARREMMKEVG